MRARSSLLAALVACVSPATASGQDGDLAGFVDPMIGTAPPGFVFPGAAVPFGMVQNSPDTTGEFAYGGYLYTDPVIRGISLVHLSGPGVKKAGDLPFMPTLVSPTNDPNQYASSFSHAGELAEPGYYRVRLDTAATDVELTASTRAAMQRYSFPPATRANLIVDVSRRVDGVHEGSFQVTGADEVSGWVRSRYPVYFVARFNRPFASSGTFKAEGQGAGGWVSFDTTTERTVTMRAGISFVDLEGARRNLDAEAPSFDFDAMRRSARASWNDELARVQVSGGSDVDRRSFYTALYHSQLHPNVFTDADGRYRGFDDRVHQAGDRIQYANFSLWDLYKSQNQLLALIQPQRYREMLLSLLADYQQAGKLPRWGEQNGDAAHMSGDPAIPAIADGLCRGLLDRPSADALYRAGVDLTQRRKPELDALGYLPMSPGTTLEYGVADFSLALIADALGYPVDAERRLSDSLRYRKIFDPDTRWIRPRLADGSWHSPFDPTDGTGFQEGNSWQYSWLAPHDARGLFDRMGGDRVAIERLDELFRLPPEALSRLNVFGLVYRTATYAPGNEHDLQVPWMYPFARAPWRTMDELRDVQSLFRPSPDGLPGNDDLGGLSAWHVFSALGFGPVTPGAPFYVLGSPQFPKATISVPGRPDFSVEAPAASLLNRYVRSARLTGRPLDRAWFEDASVEQGGALELEMSSEPNTDFAAAARATPPSAGDSALARFGCRTATSSFRPARPARTPIRLTVRPRRAQVGRHVRFRFRARVREAGSWRPLRAATVRFAGRRVRTDRRGRVTIARRLLRPRRYPAVATRRGFRRARVSVRAVRPRQARP